jgi:hypothetical protein
MRLRAPRPAGQARVAVLSVQSLSHAGDAAPSHTSIHVVLFGNVSVKGNGGPEGPLRTVRLLKLFEDLFLSHLRDQTPSARSLLRNEAVTLYRLNAV